MFLGFGKSDANRADSCETPMDADGCAAPPDGEPSPTPASYRLLGARIHGDHAEVLEFQSPTAGVGFLRMRPNDVLVEVCFSDANPVDLQKLRGRGSDAGRPFDAPPHVPGCGGSGRVAAVGTAVPNEDGRWAIGTPVCFLADPTRPGSYATHVAVDANCVAPIRSSAPGGDALLATMRSCASIGVAGLTAYESLQKCGLSGAGSCGSLLVVGAAGGVGSWTLVLARALNPSLEIVATASTPDQHEWCTALGANRVIRHDEIGAKLGGGREGSVDSIVCLAEPAPGLFGALSEVIRPYGSICLVSAGESIKSLDLGFCFFKCVDVKTETVFSSIRTGYRKIVPAEELGFVAGLVTSGRINAPLSPDAESGRVSESFRDALSQKGVLEALSRPTGKRGNFVMRID